MKRRVLRALAAAAVVLLGAHPALAQEVTLRFAHWLPPTHPLNQTGFIPWAQSIEKASGGSLKVQIFPAQQLGAAADHYDMARDGIASVTFVNPGYQPGRFPIADAAGLPFLIANSTGGSAAFHDWYAKYAPREMGDVKVCLGHLHAPATIHSKRPVRVPEDIRGLKVRPAHATVARFVSLLGGTNVHLAAPESREALERGVADAITFPWGSLIRPWSIDKAVNYHLDLPLYVTAFVIPFNKRAYEGLTSEHKKVVDAHCTPEWAEKVATGWAESENRGYKELTARPNHTVHTPTAEEVRRWRQAAAPLYDEWMQRIDGLGLKGQAVLDELRSALKARGALAE